MRLGKRALTLHQLIIINLYDVISLSTCSFISFSKINELTNATRSVLLQFVEKLDSYCTTFDLAVVVSYNAVK